LYGGTESPLLKYSMITTFSTILFLFLFYFYVEAKNHKISVWKGRDLKVMRLLKEGMVWTCFKYFIYTGSKISMSASDYRFNGTNISIRSLLAMSKSLWADSN
jgi:hypothetical protein